MIKRIRIGKEYQNMYSRKDILDERVRRAYPTVERLINNEIKKGKHFNTAIEDVMASIGLRKLYPDLEDEDVRRKISNAIRTKYINKEKRERDEK